MARLRKLLLSRVVLPAVQSNIALVLINYGNVYFANEKHLIINFFRKVYSNRARICRFNNQSRKAQGFVQEWECTLFIESLMENSIFAVQKV